MMLLRGACLYATLMMAAGLSLPTVASAQSGSDGVTPTSILLGTSTPLTGPVAPPCKPVSDGSLSWFKYVNDRGGVNGRKIENIVLDDAYKAPEALSNGRELVAKKVFAFFAGCGTLQPPVLLPMAKQNGLLYLFPFAGNPDLHTDKNVFMLFPLYAPQYAGATTAAMKKLGPGSVYMIMADVPGATESIEAVKKAAAEAGGTFLNAERINQQESDYTPIVLKVKNAQPDFLVIFTTAPASARIFKAVVAQDAFPKKTVIASTVQAIPAFFNSIDGAADGKLLNVLMSVPPSSPRAKSCLDAFKENSPHIVPDVVSLWGCAIAQVFETALRETPEPITREKFAATLESWKDKVAAPGLPPLTFTATDHLGMSSMILSSVAKSQPIEELEMPIPRP